MSKFGERLIQAGLVTEEEVKAGLNYQGAAERRIGEALWDLGYIGERELLQQLSPLLRTKFVSSSKLLVMSFPEALLNKLTLGLVQQHLVFPILLENDALGVVASDRLSDDTVEQLRVSSGCGKVVVFLTLSDTIQAFIDCYYRDDQAALEELRHREGIVKPMSEQRQPASSPLDQLASTEPTPTPVITPPQDSVAVAPQDEPAINAVLRQLVQLGGSDLHLCTAQPPLIRKDGDIIGIPSLRDRLSSELIHGWVAEVAADHVVAKFDETGDADFAHEVEGLARFRMNWFKDINGVGAVMRTIPSRVPTLEELNSPPALKSFCGLAKGLVVVTGPTGSGKSTTMAAMVDHINKTRRQHIITIEDPVEFVHQTNKCLINQREVQTHTESFAVALRAALREDPDIVLVGEMRDLETVAIAMETAETGHLVFGTLHTNTAPSTVDRIIDQFPTDQQAQIRVMLSESLAGVVSQTLCKKRGGGRVACVEILMVNNAISNLIREGKTFQIKSIMQTSRGVGMQTQADAMLELVKSGQVEPAEAIAKSVEQSVLTAMLDKAGFGG